MCAKNVGRKAKKRGKIVGKPWGPEGPPSDLWKSPLVFHTDCGTLHAVGEPCPTKFDLLKSMSTRVEQEEELTKNLSGLIQNLADKMTEASHDPRKMRKLIKELRRTREAFLNEILANAPTEEKPWYFTRSKP